MRLISRGLFLVSTQAPEQPSSADEVRAGARLVRLIPAVQGFTDTPESKAIEFYPQTIGDKVAQKRAAQAALLVSPRSLMPADREGLKLAVAGRYFPHAAVELLEVFQFLSRDAKPSPRHKDSPSLEERIPPVKGEIKNPDWTSQSPKNRWITVDFVLHPHPSLLHLSI